MEALLVSLQGPMASWGTLVVGDNRETGVAPTQSALIGLLGACCGIDRSDTEALDQWFDLWQTVTVHVTRRKGDLQPWRFYDFHTARDTLKLDGTLNSDLQIGHRGYLQEAFAIAVFILREGADPRLLSAARSCLQAPVYTPYLGRLCNPLTVDLYLKQGSYASIEALLDEMARLLQSTESRNGGSRHGLNSSRDPRPLNTLCGPVTGTSIVWWPHRSRLWLPIGAGKTTAK